MTYTGPCRLSRLPMIWLLTRSPPPPPSSIRSTGDTQEERTEKDSERQLADGKNWGGDSGGAISYDDGEKAWSSINYSILSECNYCMYV
jgi:hypothetical protein